MQEIQTISGRDVRIFIDDRELFTAEKAEIRKLSEFHSVRSCFCSDDTAMIRQKSRFKANFQSLRLKNDNLNINFFDLDNFNMKLLFDGNMIKLSHCMWQDFAAVAELRKFCEYISVSALDMSMEAES